MTSLATRLGTIDFARDLQQVHDILYKATSTVTWYGERRMVLASNPGSVSLNSVIQRVYDAAVRRCMAGNLTRTERLLGTEIVSSLRALHTTADCNISQRNYITRLFYWIHNRLPQNRRLKEMTTLTPPKNTSLRPSEYLINLFLSYPSDLLVQRMSRESYNELTDQPSWNKSALPFLPGLGSQIDNLPDYEPNKPLD